MDEHHENEQYFFDERTASHLADFLSLYEKPCCLCAPTVGQELERRRVEVRILDIDERFQGLRGFRYFDLSRPPYLVEKFGIILFDPPFFNAAPIAQFLGAIRMLARYEFDQKLLISWPTRRSALLLKASSQFGLEPTGYQPGYLSVANEGKNEIEFYGNLGLEEYLRLADAAKK